MTVRLARGQRVGDRYRLERELGRGSNSVTWTATDERLDRSVAVRVFDQGLDRDALMKRAGLAASLTHPRVVRVFDTGQDGSRFFTVSELLPTSLHAVRLPLSPDQALSTAIDVTEAIRYAHERGIVHGHLHEGNVLLSESGAKVGDFALAGPGPKAERSDDLVQLGHILRRTAGPEASPELGIGRVIEGLSTGAYDDANAVLRDLHELRPAVPGYAPGRRRRGWIVAVVVTILVALAAFGATQLGDRHPQTRFAPGGRIDGTALPVASATDFDPLGDQAEGPRTVGNLIDDDPATFWSTERYHATPDFNGRKPGVGVILDLGASAEIGKAQLLFTTRGCSFELRYTDDRAAPVDQWLIAATVADSPASAPILFSTQTARYWLIWLTKLTSGVPGAGSNFACAIAEAELYAP